ncbi:hypothetical protein ACN47E_002539 [Coniothyrium glycines]
MSQHSYTTAARPAFAPLQSSSTSHSSSYSSTTSMASRSSSASVPPTSPTAASQQQQQQQQQFYASLNQQTSPAQQQRRLQAQRHPSFEYQPSRQGAGATAAETTQYLNQAALLAEAAKRAQMACVMRDLDGMEL